MIKWMVVYLHKVGPNIHGYWTNSSWSNNREHACLYPGERDAQLVIEEMPIADGYKVYIRAMPVHVEMLGET